MFEQSSFSAINIKIGSNEFIAILADHLDWGGPFLAIEDKILLFENENLVMKFFSDKEECNFSKVKEFNELQEKAEENIFSLHREEAEADFDETGALLRDFDLSNWNSSQFNTVITTLGFLVDCILTLNNDNLIVYFHSGIYPETGESSLGDFIEAVTQCDSELLGDQEEMFNPKEPYDVYSLLIGQITLNSIVYK